MAVNYTTALQRLAGRLYTVVSMLRDQIRLDITKAISKLRVLGLHFTDKEIEVTRTVDPKFGDYTSNVALRLIRQAQSLRLAALAQGKKLAKFKQTPLQIASFLADSLKDLPYVEKLEVAGPGFLNFYIKPEVWQKEVDKVLKSGAKYGSNDLGKGKKARVEFVSANPTGPLHFGNARGGPIGDALASVLEFSGYKVMREYYHNDVGGQVEKLGQSVQNVYMGQKLEDQEYKGRYILDLVNKLR